MLAAEDHVTVHNGSTFSLNIDTKALSSGEHLWCGIQLTSTRTSAAAHDDTSHWWVVGILVTVVSAWFPARRVPVDAFSGPARKRAARIVRGDGNQEGFRVVSRTGLTRHNHRSGRGAI